MTSPRWKKILHDLTANKVRTLLVALSIAVGVFAVGFVANTYLILKEDVPADFRAANPHAALLHTAPFDKELLDVVRRMPEVAEAEGRGSLSARLLGRDGKTYPLTIQMTAGIEEREIDRLRLEAGSADLKRHEVYMDRVAAGATGYGPGDRVRVELADGSVRELRLAATVQDANGDSFIYNKQATLYCDADTTLWLGGSDQYTQLVLTVSQQPENEEHVRQVAAAVTEKVKDSGRNVSATLVSKPGEHPNQGLVTALLGLMSLLGLLSLGLSGFLVANTLSALMSQQIRQIGIMKAVGASVQQLTGLYVALVLSFGLVALLAAVPASAAASSAMCAMMAKMLNVNLAAFRIPFAALALQIGIGLGVPVLAALVPVRRGTRMTVRAAVTSQGAEAAARPGLGDRLFNAVRFLPRQVLLSLRSTFRRTGRLALTLATLVLGGAIFIAVFGVRDSIYAALDKTFGYTMADVNVYLSRPYRIERLRENLASIDGIVAMEGWGQDMAQVLRSDGNTTDDVQVISLANDSRLVVPVMTSGRWLVPQDYTAVVVGNHYVKRHPETRVGDVIRMRFGEKEADFTIVGIYEMAGNPTSPMVFANYQAVAELTGRVGQAAVLRIVTDRSDAARQREVQQAIETRLAGLKMQALVKTGSDNAAEQGSLVKVLVIFLLAMALLIALVGGLGLAGTMSLNVMERTREIGIMRSIGAVDAAIFQMVLGEGLLIGLFSWALGALLSNPIARVMDRGVGVAMMNVPLGFVFSWQGVWIWLVVVLVISGLASLAPARRAVRMTIRDGLAYE